MDNNKDLYEKAKNYALLNLSYRAKTIKEMKEKLNKKFSEEIVIRTINFLKEYKYLNDFEYAKAYINSNMKHKYYGKYYILHKLSEKGIPRDMIEDAFLVVNYCEIEILEKLFSKNYDKYSKLENRNKWIRYCKQKGFSYQNIQRVLKR